MSELNSIGFAISPAAALTPLGGNAPAMSSNAFASFLNQAALGGGNIPGLAEASLPQKSPEALLNQINLLSFGPTSLLANEDTALTEQQDPSDEVLTEIKTEQKDPLTSESAGEAAAACLQAIQQILTRLSLDSTAPTLSKGDLAQINEVLARLPELKEHFKPNQIQELQSLIQSLTQGLESAGRSSLNQPQFTVKDAQNTEAKPVALNESKFVEGSPVDSPMLHLSQKLKSLLKESTTGSLMEKGQAFVKPQETSDLNNQVSSQPFADLIVPLASTEPKLQTEAKPILEKAMAMPAELRENIFKQVIHSMNFSLKEGQSEMQIHLKPEFLGQMSMKIAVEDGLVAASFTVENHQVKELLESSLSNLRQSLTNQGLKVDTLSVSIGSGGAFSDLSHRQNNWTASTPQHHSSEEYREAETEIAQVSYDKARSWTTGSMDYIV